MELQARRIFRFALVTALSATIGFAMQLNFTVLPPVLAILLSLEPAPPPGFKAMLALVTVVVLTTGIGLLLVPMLLNYPLTALLLVGLGLYTSSWLMVHLNQQAVGVFLAMGFVLISAVALANEQVALLTIASLAGGMVIVILVQWLVYPFFPEDPSPAGGGPPADAPPDAQESGWIALRSTLIVLPVYIAALSNPSLWMAALIKALTLGQQRSFGNARQAGIELLGSTFLGGCFAVLFWALLSILPHLWTLFLLALALGIYGASKLFGLLGSRYTSSLWLDTLMTLWIMLAPAVADSANGKDVYKAFFVRFFLFVWVTLYAWVAMVLLEAMRHRARKSATAAIPD